MANRRWTKQEDDILMKNVIENYDNLSQVAFPKTAIELERSINGCRQRWYLLAKTQNICFTSISEKKALKNRKSLPKNYAADYNQICKKKGKLKSIMSMIKQIFKP